MYFIYVIEKVVYVGITAICLAMFGRAIVSWLPLEEDNKIENFLYCITEPVIVPVRALLERSEFVANSPIDISFFATFLILSMIATLLS